MMKYLSLLLLFFVLTGCKQKHSGPYKVRLVVLGEMPKEDIGNIMVHFKTLLPRKTISVDTLITNLPDEAYYKPRNRYRAETLLKYLKDQKETYDVLIGVTKRPISSSVHGYKDYGICGLAYTGNNVAVISSFHLDRELFLQTIRHEWGHASLGISHCEHADCIMNSAKGKAENLRGHSSFEGKCGEKYLAFCSLLQ